MSLTVNKLTDGISKIVEDGKIKYASKDFSVLIQGTLIRLSTQDKDSKIIVIDFNKVPVSERFGQTSVIAYAEYMLVNNFFFDSNTPSQFEDYFENQLVTYTLYETISSGTTSDSLATQAGIEIIRDSFSGADLDVSELGGDGYPTDETVEDSMGNAVFADFVPIDTPPDWTLVDQNGGSIVDTNGQDYALLFKVRGSRLDLTDYLTNNPQYNTYDDRAGNLDVVPLPAARAFLANDTPGIILTTPVTCPIDTWSKVDSAVSLSGGFFTFLISGRYFFIADITIDEFSGDNRTEFEFYIESDLQDGSGFQEVRGTRRRTYSRLSDQGANSATAAIIIDAVVGHIYRVVAYRRTGISTGFFPEDSCSVSIVRLFGAKGDPGPPGPPGGPEGPPGPQGPIGYGVYAFATVSGAGNILDGVGLSVTRVALGTYDIQLDSPLISADYVINAQPYGTANDTNCHISARTPSGFRILIGDADNGPIPDVPQDTTFAIAIFTTETGLGITGPITNVNGQTGPVVNLIANNIPYNNSVSGLSATDVQAAIDEILLSENTRRLLVNSTNGQTIFNLPEVPIELDKFVFTLNGSVQAFGLDYTIGGSTLTYNERQDVVLNTDDDIEFIYYY